MGVGSITHPLFLYLCHAYATFLGSLWLSSPTSTTGSLASGDGTNLVGSGTSALSCGSGVLWVFDV
ncbi:hypothetical protein [Moraxella lacunata]|uniref:hypothetical protein n=1 Tax=Moraxella lacunata TaxID=477 RepID=UPI003EDE9071